jgi:YgiT-type zinc finger domain-containing protein
MCGGELEAQRVTRLQRYEGHWVLIENVPVLVCRQCGEIYYTPQAHDRVVDLISGGSQPVRTESIPVFDADGAA